VGRARSRGEPDRYVIVGGLAGPLSRLLADRFAPYRLVVRVADSGADFHRLCSAPGAALAVLGGSTDADTDGLDWVLADAPAIPKILVDPCGSKERAVRALRLGFSDYVDWPSDVDELWTILRRQISDCETALRVEAGDSGSILFASALMRERVDYARRVAAAYCSVLLCGETGTGKELFAEFIHTESDRRAKPLLRLNCAALPEHMVEAELFGYQRGAFTGATHAFPGRLVLAHEGTLFLDEIGDLAPAAQAKVLRAVETGEVTALGASATRKVDIRIIAATNQPLEHLVEAKQFRADLFFRLNIARIDVPPLRARSEDIPLLFNHFLRLCTTRSGRPLPDINPDVIAALLAYAWPGNVRELRNVVEGALIACPAGLLTLEALPEAMRGRTGNSAEADERRRVVSALMQTRWNKSDAARLLNWSRMTLYRKISRYGIGSAPKPVLSQPVWASPTVDDGITHRQGRARNI
jgi:DNA-binding NtrC family response regulator